MFSSLCNKLSYLLVCYQFLLCLHLAMNPMSHVEASNHSFPSGSNLNLNCSGEKNSNPNWKLPSTTTEATYLAFNVKPLSQRLSLSNLTRTKDKYVRTLHVSNVSFLDAGIYVCHYGNKTNEEHHVFVKDDKNPILPPNVIHSDTKNEKRMSVKFSQSNIPIGCGTADNSIKVELKKQTPLNEYETIAASSFPTNNWVFDSFKGFLIKNEISWDIAGNYRCVGSFFRNNVKHASSPSIDFKIDVYGVEILPPRGLIIIGSPMEIGCRGENYKSMNLSWRWISHGAIIDINKDRLPPGAVEIVDNQIKWESVGFLASGIYQCYDSNDLSLPSSNFTLSITSLVEYERLSKSRSIPDPKNHPMIFKAGFALSLSCSSSNVSSVLRWLSPPRLLSEADYYTARKATSLKERRMSIQNFSDENQTWSVLTVSDAHYLDTGYYTCFADNSYNNVVQRQFVYVEDSKNLVLPPALQRTVVGDFRVIGHYSESNVLIGCAPSHPSVTVVVQKTEENDEIRVVANSSEQNSRWTFNSYEGFRIKLVNSWELKGYHVCVATSNTEAKRQSRTEKFKIKIEGVQIMPLNLELPLIAGDNITLKCRSKNKDTVMLSWRWIPFDNAYDKPNIVEINSTDLLPGVMYPLEEERQESFPSAGSFVVHELRWKEISAASSGVYQCYDGYDIGVPVSNITLNVSESVAPLLDGPTEQEFDVQRGEELALECKDVAGTKSNIRWFKTVGNETQEIFNERYHAITISPDRRATKLLLHYPTSDADYICSYTNHNGTSKKIFRVAVHGLSDGIIAAIVVVSLLIAIFVVLLAFFVRKSHKQKLVYQEMLNNRLKLLEGNLERLNPNAPLEEQLDLLPYDSKYEFSSNHLVLGKQLGAGQFGRVLKAKAVGMGPGNTTVAVKMVKSQADNTGLSSLAAELKVLIHLGSHLNVVCLLGACTKNLIKGELMVIVEFCRYGNMQDFLMANRRYYVNELDNAGIIKPLCYRHDPSIPPLPPTLVIEPNKDGLADTNGEDNEKPRYWIPVKKDSVPTRSPKICTHDLIGWSFQVACGMNYLKKRKVLHGDLAARNVLLADDDIVKIADFGLSRQVYKDCNYHKQGQEALPVKWMAIESLLDRVFSSQSDVWAYGVTIWEFFSLSKQPYPDVNELSELIRLLESGQRMDKPEYAPASIGDLMLQCWKHNPDERITFEQLERFLGELVDDNTRQRFASSESRSSITNTDNPIMTDYLRMTSVEQTASSNYQNMNETLSRKPKLYPQLSTCTYVNTSIEPSSPRRRNSGSESPSSPTSVIKIDSEVFGVPEPLSPAPSLAESNYLPMHPATLL